MVGYGQPERAGIADAVSVLHGKHNAIDNWEVKPYSRGLDTTTTTTVLLYPRGKVFRTFLVVAFSLLYVITVGRVVVVFFFSVFLF